MSAVAEKALDGDFGVLLVAQETADLLRCSIRTVHELTRKRTIPHVRTPGGGKCLYPSRWVEAWLAGAELETRELDDNGRVVSPRGARAVAR